MSSKKEKLLKKIDPKLLQVTPKLSGDAGSFIDLNSCRSYLEDGAKKLMLRFLKNQDLNEKNRKSQKQSDITILRVNHNENKEICELISERLKLPFKKDDSEITPGKPGRKLQQLKMELQDKMSAKWEEEYKKRVTESQGSKDYNDIEGNSESELSEDENCSSESVDGNDNDESDNDIVSNKGSVDVDTEDCNTDKEKKTDEENDNLKEEGKRGSFLHTKDINDIDETEEPKDIEEGTDEGIKQDFVNFKNNCTKDDFEEDDCSLLPVYQPGGGLLYGSSELTQNVESLPQNLFSPSLKLSISQSSCSKSYKGSISEDKPDKNGEKEENLFSVKVRLFQDSPNTKDTFDLNDALEFCSGRFPDEDENPKTKLKESKKFDLNVSTKEKKNYEELGRITNLSETRKSTTMSNKSGVEDTFDSQEDVDEENEVLQENLSSEDDESLDQDAFIKKKKTSKQLQFSDDESEADDLENEEEEEKEEEEEGEEEEDLDQRSIYYDSEENEILNPKEFFEGEAELSGSEWSGDEDEKGLDEYDMEEGDADNLDNDQVRSQLEKIHMRRILDDDAREVRLIQEILFEDGDLHSEGKGRERRFKWKNLGLFDDKPKVAESKGETGNSSDEDCAEEEELRKMRHEKELFLMERKKEDSVEEIFEEVTWVKSCVTKEAVSTVNSTVLPKNLVSSAPRGSFLIRNNEFLSKLAKLTATASDFLASKGSKNFVFATKSPEKINPAKSSANKRQMEESEECVQPEKKMKTIPKKIETGPSILDLFV